MALDPCRKYLLAELGRKRVDGDVGEVFEFNGDSFTLIFECKIKALLRDVCRLKEFTLELISPDHQILGVYFHPALVEILQSYTDGLARNRMAKRFFTEIETPDEAEPAADTESETLEDYEHLYERLRKKHVENPRVVPQFKDAQHKHLRPRLRQYQKDAVNFMMHRETVPDSIPAAFDTLKANAIEGREFYLNSYSGELTDERPGNVLLPTGGIIADEMGLGKTVEVLALILNNPRKPTKSEPKQTQPGKDLPSMANGPVRCTCSGGYSRSMIRCQRCLSYQHLACVQRSRTPTSTETVDNYICPQCWPQEKLVPTRATIIVSPAAIKGQWMTEIQTHIRDPAFKVMMYEGVSRGGWISPLVVAQHDVVIVDYNVLRAELPFAVRTNKYSREDRKYLAPSSPLTSLMWWRVCLDEAQMVESTTTMATKMVKTLHTVHRWAVTGTPIEKSINQLFGLLHFLDAAPYNELPIWKTLAQPFLQDNNPDPLIEGVLQNIMWRTCKRHVIDQLGIPPQTQRCHMVAMSDMQSVFYREQHELCRGAFLERAAKLERRGLAGGVYKWDRSTVNFLFDPLRKLRQDCTMPSIVASKGEQVQNKRLLSPDELYKYMLTTSERESKGHLRSIVSSLNGLAGISMLLQNYPLASRYYKAALKRAEENKDCAVTVDSLLQIHALHYLVQMLSQKREGVEGGDQLDEFRQQQRMLEGKYTSNYYQAMRTAKDQLDSVSKTLNVKRHQEFGHWWRRFLTNAAESSVRENDLVKKINVFLWTNRSSEQNTMEFSQASGIDYTLTTWWDKVSECRNLVHQGLDKLRYFTEKIRPGYVATELEYAKIKSLLVAAADCHLMLEKKRDDNGSDGADEAYEPPQKVRRNNPCELCKLKIALSEYECKIFDKNYNQETREGDGSWNPSWQELVVRTLSSTLRRLASKAREERDKKGPSSGAEAHAKLVSQAEFYTEVVSDMEDFPDYMDKLKAEFQELSKYWVEINYTVAAYDELNMCKMQFTAVDPETLKKGEKLKRHQISIHEIDLTRTELQAELNAVELEFAKGTRNMSYLRHLASNPEVHRCPICDIKPEDKYSVWACGHQVCIQCLLRMKRHTGVKLNCPICRHPQEFKDVHYVTVKNQPGIEVQGKYSSKILRIVQEVKALLKEDPFVKVIIFSQWDNNLTVIASALEENDIIAQKSSPKVIEEFKSPTSGMTCLIMRLAWGSKGLNLTEATHVFLVEPIMNPSEELQAIGRIHRIGQTKPTVVHRFIVKNTIEETIYKTVSNDSTGKWKVKDVTMDNLKELFTLNNF